MDIKNIDLDKSEEFYFKANKALWNVKTPIHVKSEFYENDAFLNGKSSLTEVENEFLPEVKGKRLIHLQCHFGQDTISLERMGAHCTGIDFSNIAIEHAQKTAMELNLSTKFYESNVYDVLDLNLGKFDIVFTSYGVLSWLPDLKKWADVISGLLKPGGLLYIAEFHPLLYMYEFESQELQYPYGSPGKVFSDSESFTYADRNYPLESVSYFWQHNFDEIISAVLDNDLEILRFKEIEFSPYNCFPHMKEIAPKRYQYGKAELKIPHIFHILARKRGE